MSKLLLTSGFKWIDPKDLNKYSGNSSRGCVLEFYLEYPKELQKLHNYYPLDTDDMETKSEFNYRLLTYTTFPLVMLKN